MNNSRGFSSRIGFIFAMAAFCIGIGNLWKFPYVVGNSGGGAFLLVYVIMVLVFGIPAFAIELALGRASGLSPVAGMRKLEGKKHTGWAAIGWLGAASIFIICSYANTIVGGWTGGYIVKVVTGEMNGMTAEEIGGVFGGFAGSNAAIGFSVISAVLLLLCLISGVKKGVERVCSILLPALFVIMIGLAVYSNTLPGAFEGLKWYLTPDFSKITFDVVAAAGMQVCFSIGIGMCCAFVYGSYLSKDEPLAGSVVMMAVMDTFIAFLAGLLIVPALFAFGIEPAAGPSLVYITLPELFNDMGSFGNVFGCLFMICVYFAGFTSILGGAESLVACITDQTKIERKPASVIVTVAIFLVSILVTLSFRAGTMGELKILNLGFFDFLDFLSSGIGLPFGALLMLLYVMFRWKYEGFQTEINLGAKKIRFGNGLKYYFYICLPILLIFVCYTIINSYVQMIMA